MAQKYGIQMYSLRDLARKDLKAGLKAVADMGYKGIEFAGFVGNTAEDVRSWLDEFGLECWSTHTGWRELAADQLDATIRYHKTIGNDFIIVPGFNGTEEEYEEMVKTMKAAEPILKEAGIRLGYHNHSYEYLPSPSGKDTFHKRLEDDTDFLFEIDTFWAFNAGLDPVAEITRLKDRTPYIHLKDGFPAPDHTVQNAHGVSIGDGQAPVIAVREKAMELGMRIVVESEGCDPTGVDEVGRCIRFLRTLEK